MDFLTFVAIYLIGQGSIISSYFGNLGFFTLLGTAIWWCVRAFYCIEYNSPTFLIRGMFIAPIVGVIFVLISSIIPTQKTATLLVAAYAVTQAAQTDAAKSIAGNSVKIIEQYLNNNIQKLIIESEELKDKTKNIKKNNKE